MTNAQIKTTKTVKMTTTTSQIVKEIPRPEVDGREKQASPIDEMSKPKDTVTQQAKKEPVTTGFASTKPTNIPFAPINVMYASTPKRGEGGSIEAIPISSTFDVSKILNDEPETPLRGHKIQRYETLNISMT